MSARDDDWTIRRILVALDASRHSLAALDAAVELAASMGAKLEGLFVEDVNLLRAAELPATRETRYPFSASAQLDPARMARDLRAQATQARRALASVCERRKVRWSFRVARGDVTAEVLSAALEADLLTLGKVSRPLLRRVRVGSTARAAAEGAPCCVLLLQRETDVRPPVVVTYDGSPAARKALLIAAHLALRNKGHVAVLVIAGDPDAAHRLRAEASSQLRGKGLLIRYHPLGDTSAKALALALRTEKGATLVLVGGILQATESLQDLLNDLDCPVLLVR